jgi:uncharacterized protein (DUF486 family)
MRTILLLFGSNIFMTFAWYGHLKNLKDKPLIIAILMSWGIAFFEYLLQVPANRIGARTFNLGQLKIIQEIITMTVFGFFSYFYMKRPFSLNYLYAAFFMLGAAYFIFKDTPTGA